MDLAGAQAVVDKLFELQKAGNYEEAAALFSEDGVAELPMMLGSHNGRAAIIETWKSSDVAGKIASSAPNLSKLSAMDDGTFKRSMETSWMGIPYTFNQYFTFNGGLITKMSTAAFS
ncbi:hypothetical protein CYMTET_44129 [Cymbomonas tetramitiformis]|uniref:Uncharacterized protein n=1 Tax=Cymbomonas tetramitiformis TaxID=36881 RepID=A0AAE0C2R7_9CHLO|nr:hypothetical protein CYMTET_44129 [Cymbomonas tetramitiformis]